MQALEDHTHPRSGQLKSEDKITKTCPFFFSCKNLKFSIDFFFHIFLIFAQNIDYGYTIEPPH